MYDLRIIKYYRISSDDDNDLESNSITYQRELINKYIEENFSGMKILSDEIMDDGYSGTSFKRPGITKALNELMVGNYDCLIVKDFSRFGRDHIQVGNYMERIFPEIGIRFISVNDGYDSKSLIGRTAGIDVVIKNLIHEMYSKDLSQKMRSSINTMMKEGKYISHNAFYGYVKDGKYGLKINNEVVEIIRFIFERAALGNTMTAIAKELNENNILTPAEYNKSKGLKGIWDSKTINFAWTAGTVRKIVNDERYTGKMISGRYRSVKTNSSQRVPFVKENWIYTENTHEPIISQELFDKVHSKIMHFSRPEKIGVRRNPTSIYKCGGCGYTLLTNRGKIKKYICSKCNLHISDNCIDHWILCDDINDVLKTIIKNQFDVMLGNAKLYKESQKKAYSRVDLENEIAVLRRKKFDLYEQYKKGIISREQFNDKKVEISDSILDIEHKIPDADVCSDNLSHSADMVVNYGAPNDIGEDFIKYFIKEVKVFNDKRLKITWNFNLNELLTMEENV